MYCKFCGKELKAGEICSCQDKTKSGQNKNASVLKGSMAGNYHKQINSSNKYENKENSNDISALDSKNRKALRKPGWNKGMVTAWIVFAIAAVLAVTFSINGENWLGKWELWDQYRSLIVTGIPAALFCIALIIALVSLISHRMRGGCVAAVITSMLMGIGFGVVTGWNYSQDQKVIALFDRGFSEDNLESIKDYYADAQEKNNEKRQRQVEEQAEKTVSSIYTDFIEGNIAFDNAKEELEKIKSTGLLASEIEETETQMEALKSSFEAYSQGEQLAQEGDFLNAIEQYSAVIEEDPNYEEAQRAMENLTEEYKADILVKADTLADQKNYPAALDMLKEGEDTLGENADIAEKEKSITEQYVQYALAEAETAEAAKEFSRAREIIADALNYTSSSALNEKMEEYKKYENISLLKLPLIDSDRMDISDEDKLEADTYGNTYESSFVLSSGSTGRISYAYFNTDGNYKFLRGTFAAYSEMGTGDRIYQVTVYADDQKVYTSPELKKVSQPTDLNIDIGYAKVIQIQVVRLDEGSNDGGVKVIFGNMEVSNEN